MSREKRQHYVPQFYLKSFSFNEIPKQIWIYNLSRKKCFKGNIKTVCSKNYFYDEDGSIEKTLSKLENSAVKVFQKIINLKGFPNLNLKEYTHFLTFITLQYGRTKIQSEMSLELANKLFNKLKPLIAKEKGIDIKELKKFKLGHKHPVLYSSLYSLLAGSLIADLNCILLINNTNNFFITSDHPVIFFNPFFNKIIKTGTIGLAQRGVIIHYPISPTLSLFFYDSQYYSMKGNKNSIIKIKNPKDIRRLNGLHLLFCEENIYFNDKKLYQDIKLQHSQLASKKGKTKDRVEVETMGFNIYSNKIGEIIRHSRRRVVYNLNKLSFLKTNNNAPSEIGIRNPKLFEDWKRFVETKVEKKFEEEKNKHKD